MGHVRCWPFGSYVAVELRNFFQLYAWLRGTQRLPSNSRSPHGGVMSLRIENADRDQQFFVYDPHGFGQVGVIRNDN